MSGSASQSMAALSAAGAEASGISWWAASDADLLEQAIVLERVTRQVAATQLALVAEIHARNAAVTAGARSTASWLVAKTGVPRGAANRAVQTATRMAHHARPGGPRRPGVRCHLPGPRSGDRRGAERARSPRPTRRHTSHLGRAGHRADHHAADRGHLGP